MYISMGNSEKIAFGTGGWRAVIGDDFIKVNIQKVGQGVALLIKENGHESIPVVIGYDRRFLSDSAARWLAEVLCGNGITVEMMKRSAPTPLIMHTVKKRLLHYGLEVTASHNPSNFNGIKLIIDEGRDAPIEVTSHLENLINSEVEIKTESFDKAISNGHISYIKNPFNDFIDDILANLDVAAIRERGLRIAFDPMHGSGTYPLMVVLCTARCTLDIINQEKDAYFGNFAPAPSEKSLHQLNEKVITEGYDLGIAFDGDGDRVGIIDEKGEYIHANEILSMLYWYLHEYKHWMGPVVKNCATTHVLDRMAADFGEKCYEVPVGFKYISAKMEETDAVLGGESSGGLTVRGHIKGKDSTYAASLFVEMLSATGMSASQIRDLIHEKYGATVFREDVMTFSAEDKIKINSRLMEDKQLPKFDSGIIHTSYADGCKVFFDNGGFVICRFSGTEPLLRIMSEAPDEKIADGYIEAFRNFVGKILYKG